MRELWRRYREPAMYVVVGCCTTLVSLVSYYVCVETFLDAADPVQLQAANVISWICAVTFAYVTNRRLVFKSTERDWPAEAAKFAGARLSTLVIDMACMALLVSVLRLDDKLAKLLVQIIVFVLNYLFSKLFVFRSKGGSA